jgi:hypothetical protein
MNEAEVRREVHKRLTLNWLIQGAAQHAGMTFQHLVRDELDAIHPSLVRLYDQYALINLLQYWRIESVLLFGWPPRFWRRADSDPRHPFFGHAVLSRHGGALAADAKRRAAERAKGKGLALLPVLFALQMNYVIARLHIIEASRSQKLIALAKKTTEMVWGIPAGRLDAALTMNVAFGTLSTPQSLRGRILRGFVVGYGGVLWRGGSLQVVARGTNWYLVAKELVKGTAELVCLHGLNRLSDETYAEVMRRADRLEFEPWMLQTGGELWRRLLAVAPEGWPLAQMLMHLARLPAEELERVMLAVLEEPDRARGMLGRLAGAGAEPDEWAERSR